MNGRVAILLNGFDDRFLALWPEHRNMSANHSQTHSPFLFFFSPYLSHFIFLFLYLRDCHPHGHLPSPCTTSPDGSENLHKARGRSARRWEINHTSTARAVMSRLTHLEETREVEQSGKQVCELTQVWFTLKTLNLTCALRTPMITNIFSVACRGMLMCFALGEKVVLYTWKYNGWSYLQYVILALTLKLANKHRSTSFKLKLQFKAECQPR